MMDETRNDHDLLIRIDEKLELLIKTNSDQEARIRRLEMWGLIAVGFLYAVQIYFQFFK